MEFKYDIREAKVIDNQIIVLLSIPFNVDEIDNIYSVSLDCKINWKVESLSIILFWNCLLSLPFEYSREGEDNDLTQQEFLEQIYKQGEFTHDSSNPFLNFVSSVLDPLNAVDSFTFVAGAIAFACVPYMMLKQEH